MVGSANRPLTSPAGRRHRDVARRTGVDRRASVPLWQTGVAGFTGDSAWGPRRRRELRGFDGPSRSTFGIRRQREPSDSSSVRCAGPTRWRRSFSAQRAAGEAARRFGAMPARSTPPKASRRARRRADGRSRPAVAGPRPTVETAGPGLKRRDGSGLLIFGYTSKTWKTKMTSRSTNIPHKKDATSVIELLGGERVLGAAVKTRLDLAQATRDGLPAQAAIPPIRAGDSGRRSGRKPCTPE